MDKVTFTRLQCMMLLEEEGADRVKVDYSYTNGSYDTFVVPYKNNFYSFTVPVHCTNGWEDFDTIEAHKIHDYCLT